VPPPPDLLWSCKGHWSASSNRFLTSAWWCTQTTCPPAPAIIAFRLLVTAIATIGLILSFSKCAAFTLSATTGSAAASALGTAYRPEGFVAIRMPLGSDDFLEPGACSRASSVSGLVTSPVSFPLAKLDKFLLLCLSLQARLTYLTRVTLWQRLILSNALAGCIYTHAYTEVADGHL
jgi:hypothetical protein